MYKVYTHTTPDGMVYVGVTCQKLYNRWKPSAYKGKSLWLYIEKFGWNNIKHEVIYTCYDRNEALEVEDEMICYYREKCCCINERRSGLIRANNINEYSKHYRELHIDEYKVYCVKNRNHIRERKMAYYNKNRENICKQSKSYRDEHREEINIKGKIKRSTPEGKIYNRVNSYNQRHPDRITITPMEAKNNYLNYGIIPDFIKNDDIPKAS